MPHTARVLRAPERDLSSRDFTTLLKAGKVADLALGEQTISGHDEREQTLNQLLAEMDGFDTQKDVILSRRSPSGPTKSPRRRSDHHNRARESLATPSPPPHQAYGSVPWRFGVGQCYDQHAVG